MRYLLLLLLFVNCTSNETEDITIEEPKEEEPRTIEVCDGCVRSWYSQGVFINERGWYNNCDEDGNIYRYEDRDGTPATYTYPSNPGSVYIIRCRKKTIEL